MTTPEARAAVRLNSICETSFGIRGYAYSLEWVHPEGEPAYSRMGIHDLGANSLCYENIETVTVIDWRAPDFVVADLMEKL